MLVILEQINNEMARVFQLVLVPDGQAFKSPSSDSSSNCFCRVGISTSGPRTPPCSIDSSTSAKSMESYLMVHDIVVQVWQHHLIFTINILVKNEQGEHLLLRWWWAKFPKVKHCVVDFIRQWNCDQYVWVKLILPDNIKRCNLYQLFHI